MESVGFKEWALVCEALGRGEQSIILRKGGIAEGRAGFQFEHREFFLFPTFFHEQLGKTRLAEAQIPEKRADTVEIRLFARMEFSTVVTDWEKAIALEPFHILTREVVRERFDYDEAPGIHVAFLRVFRLDPSWSLPGEKKYGGCRSWLNLPPLPANSRHHAIASDDEHANRATALREIIAD
ncbi:MAG: DUF1802 family protein [Chthoniobacterales bacterium]